MHWANLFAITPDDLNARQALGNEYFQAGRIEDARALLLQGIEQDPGWLPGHRGLLTIAIREGDDQSAIAVAEEALRLNPNAVEFDLVVGDLLDQAGDNVQAEARYRKLLAKVPTIDVAANNLAVLLAGDGSGPRKT